MIEEYNIGQIAKVTGGVVHGDPGRKVQHLSADSRSIPGANGMMFLAIKGERHDGHDYISEAHAHGIRCFLAERIPDPELVVDDSFCIVPNTMAALQKLAAYHRSRFEGIVMGITGSNGKTIVKEWLYQVLADSRSVIKSPRSYNSQLGVPLSLWQLSDQYEIALIEAGISKAGEMEKLEAMIHPSIGILTNIGSAHNENFDSELRKMKEKAALFKGCQTLIYRSDKALEGMPFKKILGDLNLRHANWSMEGGAEYNFILKQDDSEVNTTALLNYQSAEYDFLLPFNDEASIENLLHVITAAMELGMKPDEVARRVIGLEPVEMRLQTLKGIHNSTIVNDVYNADLAGFGMALNVLLQQDGHDRKIVILSDFFQSGMKDKDLYSHVSEALKFRDIDQVICIGSEIFTQRHLFPEGTLFFPDTIAFLEGFETTTIRDAAVLVKGARKFRFERITAMLELQNHKTVLEININALVNNLNYYRSILEPDTRIMVMVKALSYGIGSHEVASMLQHEQVDYLAVAFDDEGIRLRQSGVKLPIMVMNADESQFEDLFEYSLEPEIYSRKGLESFMKQSRYQGRTDLAFHLKLDTGMHRLGFEEKDLDWLCAQLERMEGSVGSIFTHLAASEDKAHDAYTHQQVMHFEKMANRLQRVTGANALLHVLNSAGTERFPEYQFDMVRLGIGLYGHGISSELEPVGTFRTIISQIRTLKKGETVGYSRSGVIQRDSLIATIPVGYADGISRMLGNGNYSFWVNDKFVPTVGNICMDMTMLDVTGIDATEGDLVELFGRNCPVEEMARKRNTIVYEVLTGIPERVKRIYSRE